MPADLAEHNPCFARQVAFPHIVVYIETSRPRVDDEEFLLEPGFEMEIRDLLSIYEFPGRRQRRSINLVSCLR